jgi:CO/xanthine dehydrogenase Mo-binding subunit
MDLTYRPYSGKEELMNQGEGMKSVGKRMPRVDARGKVTGKTKYLTDLYPEGMLWGKTLRSRYAHAKIIRIDVEEARNLPGIEAVLTHSDIPGHNGFGLVTPNWPVLCWDRVRYRGDAIALVAAVDEETAEKAISLIEVKYEPLPVIDTPEEAILPDAPLLHDKSNIMYSNEVVNGEVEKDLEGADLVQEGSYYTAFQEHAYLETEGGLAVYDEKEGVITVWACDQDIYPNQLQIARSLDWDPEKIRLIGSPVGGAFGGKLDISVHIHLALLAYYTKKPVRLHWSREESMVTSVKRQSERVTFKIGAKKDGKLIAMKGHIEGNSGPYDSIAPPVLHVGIECAPGPYRYSSARIDGFLAYTNNVNGGAFRGFGAPQVVFGIEQEMDKLAERLGMDPIELRLLNGLERGDIHPIGHPLNTSVGFKETLRVAQSTDLWCRREEIKRKLNERSPYRKYGVGVASALGVMGFGKGMPVFANVTIEVREDRKVLLLTGAIEIGQGNLTAYAQILAEGLDVDFNRVEVINGDTFVTPDSGSVTASKSVYMIGNAILDAIDKLKPQLIRLAATLLKRPEDELEYKNGRVVSKLQEDIFITLGELGDQALAAGLALKATGSHVMMEPEVDVGFGLAHKYNSYITEIALVGVDTGTGEVEVVRFITVPDSGRVINPAGAEGQCEGGVVQSQGYALVEEVLVKEGEFLNQNFSTYILPTALDVPEQEVIFVENLEESGPFGAKGLGEPPNDPVAAVLANAIYDAVGVRLAELPMTPEKVLKALHEKHKYQPATE